VENEIRAVKEAVGDHILKVIIETCLLTDEEKIRLCGCVISAGADFIKTSTGFSTGGATFHDVELFNEHCRGKCRIKAAGGIRTREDMEKFIQLGADRLGTSSAVRILRG
jgi:deoxyribose-phosphate aldolase